MQLQRKPKGKAEIFTGSMADVSFLLIIFFMLTTVLGALRGIDLQLPPKNSQARTSERSSEWTVVS